MRQHAPKFVQHGVTSQNQFNAAIAPAVERTLGKGEVACSNHAGSTIFPHAKYETDASDNLEERVMRQHKPIAGDSGPVWLAHRG